MVGGAQVAANECPFEEPISSGDNQQPELKSIEPRDQFGPRIARIVRVGPVSYTHLTLPTIYSV